MYLSQLRVNIYSVATIFPAGEPLETQAPFLSSRLAPGVDVTRAAVALKADSSIPLDLLVCLLLTWSSLGAEGREDIPLAVRPYM